MDSDERRCPGRPSSLTYHVVVSHAPCPWNGDCAKKRESEYEALETAKPLVRQEDKEETRGEPDLCFFRNLEAKAG